MEPWDRRQSLEIRQLRERLHNLARPFEESGPEARRARRGLPFLRWCRRYLPHYFDRPFAPFHRRMVRAVGAPGLPTFVAAFRGAGKSVLLGLARPLWRLLRGECPYVLFGGQVQKLAVQNMRCLRVELEHNPRLRGDYGAVQLSGSREQWEGRLGEPARREAQFPRFRLEAFGIGQSPRGRRFRQHRPREFVGDDLESAELARNPEREQQLWDWMMDEVIPALEPEHYRFTALGTTFGPGCMMERAAELAGQCDSRGRPLGRMFRQPALREDASGQCRSAWPERFSDDALARVRQTIGLRNWMRNYALLFEDPTRPFQPEWMRTYEEEELDREALDVVCFLDPALSRSSRGCPRALVAVGADRASGRRYVLDAWIERGSPMAMVDRLLEWHSRLSPRLIGVEQNGGYALIRPLLKLRAGGRFVPVRYVDHRVAKEVRIERLAPQFEAGLWFFPADPPHGVQTLQEQLSSYPEGYVDGPDALAGCDELLPEPGQMLGARPAPYRSVSRRTDFAAL